MRKWIVCVSTVFVLALMLSVTAFAVDSGVYAPNNIKNGIVITGNKGTSSTVTTDDGKTLADFYAGADGVNVTYAGAPAGEYLLVVTTEEVDSPAALDVDNIVYIDQQAPKDGAVAFTALPKGLSNGTYYVSMSSSANGAAVSALEPVGTFNYYAAYTLGDVNENGEIDSGDATQVLRHIVKLTTLQGNRLLAADTNKNDEVDSGDATQILRKCVRLPSTLD